MERRKIETRIEERPCTSAKVSVDDSELSLRPTHLNEYIGQERVKKSLDIAINSARARNVCMDHILLYGSQGLGKTTLAQIIANEMDTNIRYVSAPTIEKTGEIVGVLAGLNEGDIVFIDEIHRLDKQIEEVLYSAMEDYFVNITVGKDGQSKVIKLELPKFTLIGATTRAGMLSAPLRDRFGLLCKMEYYNSEELVKIIDRTSKLLKISISKADEKLIANCSRGTPRIANRNVARVRDYAISECHGELMDGAVKVALETFGIRANGLDEMDIRILKTLAASEKPMGIKTMAGVLGEDEEMIETVYEPYLLMKGYLIKTGKGRMITEQGRIQLS